MPPKRCVGSAQYHHLLQQDTSRSKHTHRMKYLRFAHISTFLNLWLANTCTRSLIRSLAMCRSFTARNEMEIIMDVEIWFFGILVECLGYIMTAYQLCRLLRGLQCRPVNAELSNNQRSHCLLKYFRRKRQKSLRKSMRISNLRHLTIRWRSADEEKAEILRTECRNLA
jgi:hypothetical protein